MSGLKSLNNIDWEHELYQLPPEMYLPFATNIIAEKCMLVIPKKGGKKKINSMFHRKRIILMKKRRKLVKSHISDCDKKSQILHLEELICDSHTHEKLHDEEIAVTKLKTNPNYFFRYVKKHSICLNEIGPLMGPTKALTLINMRCVVHCYTNLIVFLQSHIMKRLLAPFLLIIFTYSLSSGAVPLVLNELQLFLSLNQGTGQSRVTTDLFY